MRPLLIAFAGVLFLLVGVLPFTDDETGFIGVVPGSLVIVVVGQTILIGLHVALARRVRARTVAALATDHGAGEVAR
jgi:uncharacterized membrane protein